MGKSIKIAAARVADEYGDECIESEVYLLSNLNKFISVLV